MIEWVVILDNEDNDDFRPQENFRFIVVDNQGIFCVEEGIAQRFSVDYTEDISVNLTSGKESTARWGLVVGRRGSAA